MKSTTVKLMCAAALSTAAFVQEPVQARSDGCQAASAYADNFCYSLHGAPGILSFSCSDMMDDLVSFSVQCDGYEAWYTSGTCYDYPWFGWQCNGG
jgi:hypothetical protein